MLSVVKPGKEAIRMKKMTVLAAVAAVGLTAAPSAWAWGGGHDTVGRCILKKLPPEWQAKFRSEWTQAYAHATHLPDNGDPKLFKPEELAWLCANAGMNTKQLTHLLHDGAPVYGEIERLVHAIRTGDDYSAFIYLASLSHAIADGAACNHDPIIHVMTYTWSVEGAPQGNGLPVLPKTGRSLPVDFSFAESDADTKAVLARRLEALVVPDPPADITYERLFDLVNRWHVISMECNNQNSQRIIEAGAKWIAKGDVEAKREAADALCNLGLWAVERTLYVFKAAQIIAARPDETTVPMEKLNGILASRSTNEVEILRRPMANDSFARPYFAEPGRPSRVRVMYSPIDHMAGSVFSACSRAIGCQIVGSLKKLRPGLNASLMDAREFARDGLDPKVTPVIVVFRRFFGWRGFDAKGFERRLRAFAQAGGKVIWINGEPPDYLIGKDALKALRDVNRKDGYCDPKFPVPLKDILTASVAWVGPGGKREWKYVHTPNNTAGWHWEGSPQWYDESALPKDAVKLTEFRAPGKALVSGILCGSCAHIPLNMVYPHCITDDRPQLDPFCLRLDSAGEAMMLSLLDLLAGGTAAAEVATGAELAKLQENPIPAVGQNAADVVGAADAKGLRVLFIGNSITLHGPMKNGSWTNNWGMAASAREKDYVHQLAALINRQVPDSSFALLQVADKIERRIWNLDLERDFKWARDWKPDVITLFYGANVGKVYDEKQAGSRQFTKATEKVLDYIDPDRKAKVFHAEGFYIRPVLDAEKRELAAKRGDVFVPMDDLRRRKDTHGRYNHPGDLGMRLIAERFWEYIRPTLGK